jgi:hypothetical protein
MKKMLIWISSDPRVDGRAAEGVRIAAGVGAWKRVEVSLYFSGAGTLCLGDDVEGLEGGDVIQQYLPTIKEHGGRIAGAGGFPGSAGAVELVRMETLPTFLAQFDYSMRF